MFTLALTALLASVPFVTAQSTGIQYQHANGVVTLTTDDIGIKVSAFNKVPHFHFWDESDDTPGADYHVTFSKLFEANDTNGNGAYDPEVDHRYGDPYTLPTEDWDFSGFATEEEGDVVTGVHFNFTNEDTFVPPTPIVLADIPSSMYLEIEIRVHINLTNSNEMKFDIKLEGWDWAQTDSILVFQFTVADSEHGQQDGTGEPADFEQDASGYRFEFGDAYMECAEFAFADNSTIDPHQVQMRASHGEGEQGSVGKAVYLAFEYFGNETLDYDPTLGVLSADGPALLDTEQLLLIGGVAVTLLAVIALVVKTRR
ncbi:MAG: hypothetical protein PVI03_00695 [Candidatus Thorarchaeota archaeon]|jgi:hypothetical protein